MKGRITRAEFYKLHAKCPVCGNVKLRQTYVGILERKDRNFVDNINLFECGQCGKKGKVLELVAGPEGGD